MTTEQALIAAASGLAGPITSARLADVTGLPEGTVRQRLAEMCSAGQFKARIVGTDRAGRSLIEYRLLDELAEPKRVNRNDRNLAVRPVVIALREAVRVIAIVDRHGAPRRPRSVLDDGDRPEVELTDVDEVAPARELIAKWKRLDETRRQVVGLNIHGDDVSRIAGKMQMSEHEIERYLNSALDFIDGSEWRNYGT